MAEKPYFCGDSSANARSVEPTYIGMNRTKHASKRNRPSYKSLLAAGTGLSLISPAMSQSEAVKSASQPQQGSQPNILFILADDLGYGDLGCYGNSVVQTPVIDSLAGAGLRFTDFYAGASVSSPSRGCLLTGLHTGHATIRGNMCRVGGLEGEREGIPGKVRRTNLQPEEKTLGDLLRGQGYRTCLVNKWHVDGFDTTATPLDRGFDEFYGWLVHEPRSHNFYPDVRWRNRERYEIAANQNGNHADHNTDRATDEAVAFITRMGKGATLEGCQSAASQASGQPFFLYMAYNAPHVPLDAKDTLLYAGKGLPDTDRRYAAMISHMDASIGRLMNTLREQGMADNTLVIFASDNGGAKAAQVETLPLSGVLKGWKGDLWEGGIRVPLVASWTGHIKPGTQTAEPAYFPDFFATFADLTASLTSTTGDGISLKPLLTGEVSSLPERTMYWEQYPRVGISVALRKGPWKVIRQQMDQPWQLYNLKEDIGETTDLAAKYPDIVAELSRLAEEAHEPSPYWPVYPEK